MFKKSKNDPAAYKDHSFISRQSTIEGNISFVGGLHIEGRIEGNIHSKEGCLLVHGDVVGDIDVPNAIISGSVHGNITCTDHLELAKGARVHGVVSYQNMEMQLGAQVVGRLCVLSAEESRAGEIKSTEANASAKPEAMRPVTPVRAV